MLSWYQPDAELPFALRSTCSFVRWPAFWADSQTDEDGFDVVASG